MTMDTAVARQLEPEFPPEVAEAARSAAALPEEARALTITTHEEFKTGGEFLRGVKTYRKAIADAFNPVIADALKAHRGMLALKKQADAPCEEAEGIVKARLATYAEEQERVRLAAERKAAEERRRLEREAAEVAERERKALEAEAERQRIAAAEAAIEAGDDAKAERILDEPAPAVVVSPPAPIIPAAVEAPQAPKAEGISMRTVYKWRLVNAAEVHRAYLTVDEKRINAQVRALGPDAAATVGGIEVYAEQVVAARG